MKSEFSSWARVQRMMATLEPIADSDWNLVSMRIGPRLLCRPPPLGSVVLIEPDGTPPFAGPVESAVSVVEPETEVALGPVPPTEAELELLRQIDRFLVEPDEIWIRAAPGARRGWGASVAIKGAGSLRTSPLMRGGRLARGKWGKCPICRGPVVKGRYNPRIPHGKLQPDSGSVVDLRGGYMSRLRETYLLAEPETFLDPSMLQEPIDTEFEAGPGFGMRAPRPRR